MPEDPSSPLAQRVALLAELLAAAGARRLRVKRDGEELEIVRRRPERAPARAAVAGNGEAAPGAARRLDTIKADLVGIFHLGRPAPVEGEVLEEDRELGFVEALGIRNPVHSLGAGRIVAIAAADGTPVEYGQPLFLLDRG
jgi:acetyl-CoA carboxylase biotin carboxyl carrier protein